MFVSALGALRTEGDYGSQSITTRPDTRNEKEKKKNTNRKTQCSQPYMHELVNRFHIQKDPMKRAAISTLGE